MIKKLFKHFVNEFSSVPLGLTRPVVSRKNLTIDVFQRARLR